MTYVWARSSRRQISLRIGTRSLGIRRADFERLLPGWREHPLPFGWVAFYRNDPS